MDIDEYYTTHCMRCFMVVTADFDMSDRDVFCILCEIEFDPYSFVPTDELLTDGVMQ